MPLTDLPLAQLETYAPDVAAPPGLAAFWDATIAEHVTDAPARLTPLPSPLRHVETHDVAFTGYGGQEVLAWLQRPSGVTEPLPVVVQFHGYSTGRGVPLASDFVAAGFAHLQMDCRAQNWGHPTLHARTPDTDQHLGDAHVPGFLTSSHDDPRGHYYRRLITDALAVVKATAALPGIDPGRLFVQGGSQGGGLAIAAAGLAARAGVNVAGAAVDVPFLCHVRRGVEMALEGPYTEVALFGRMRPTEVETLFDTLNHVDTLHLAEWATCPALFSVGLMDPVCPPSTGFAAHHAWGGPDKQMVVYPFGDHSGGGSVHRWRVLEWLHQQATGPMVPGTHAVGG